METEREKKLIALILQWIPKLKDKEHQVEAVKQLEKIVGVETINTIIKNQRLSKK